MKLSDQETVSWTHRAISAEMPFLTLNQSIGMFESLEVEPSQKLVQLERTF